MTWQPIEGHTPPRKIVWLANHFSMRLGFWVDGKDHENFGTVGGGYIDFASSEGSGPRGLRFLPTQWHPVPPLPNSSAGE